MDDYSNLATYCTMEGIDFTSNDLLKTEDCSGCNHNRVDGFMGHCSLTTFPMNGCQESTCCCSDGSWPRCNNAYWKCWVHMHAKYG